MGERVQQSPVPAEIRRELAGAYNMAAIKDKNAGRAAEALAHAVNYVYPPDLRSVTLLVGSRERVRLEGLRACSPRASIRYAVLSGQ